MALYKAKFAVCSQINTKHTNTVWQNVKFLNVKSAGASRNKLNVDMKTVCPDTGLSGFTSREIPG
jgi:hypothetical protein